MLCHLFTKGAEKVVYLDPDIAVFADLNEIVERLTDTPIILTPHQILPNETEGLIKDNEMTSLKYGIFNLGFVAVRNDDAGRCSRNWWAKQLYLACYDDVPNGLFTDQKWCDLVPCLFDQASYIERDPGYNVASWNISTREIRINMDGRHPRHGSPLKFFHFTKINSAGDIMIEKNARDNVEVWNCGIGTGGHCRIWSLIFRKATGITANFDNGMKIPKAARILFRERADLFEYFANPFATTAIHISNGFAAGKSRRYSQPRSGAQCGRLTRSVGASLQQLTADTEPCSPCPPTTS